MTNISTAPATTVKTFNSIEEMLEQYSNMPLSKLYLAINLFKDELKGLAEDTRSFSLTSTNDAIESQSEAGCAGFDRYFLLQALLISMFLGISPNEMCILMQFDIRVRLILDLNLGDKIPSGSTLYLAEQRFNSNNTLQKAFFLVTNQIETSPEYAPFEGEDIAIDSSYMESPIAQLSSREKEAIKAGDTDTLWQSNPNRGRQIDTQAWYSIKHNELHYGYKLYCKAGVSSRIILNTFITPSNYSDFNCLIPLLQDTDVGRSVFLDSGYKSKKNEDILLSRVDVHPPVRMIL